MHLIIVSGAQKNLGTVGMNARVDSDSQNVSMRGYMLVRDPETEIIDLEHEDIITTSGEEHEGEGGNGSSSIFTQTWI